MPARLMRVQTVVKKAARDTINYSRASTRLLYNGSDALRQLIGTFGQAAHQLPPSLRVELLNPDLQRFPQRKELFKKLKITGELLLFVLVNDRLGTRNVIVPSIVLARFCEQHRLTNELGSDTRAIDYLHQCIGALNLFVGAEDCRLSINTYLLRGSSGLANLYLDALSNNEI